MAFVQSQERLAELEKPCRYIGHYDGRPISCQLREASGERRVAATGILSATVPGGAGRRFARA